MVERIIMEWQQRMRMLQRQGYNLYLGIDLQYLFISHITRVE